MNKRIIIPSLFFIIGLIISVFVFSSAKVTTFEECENAGWIVRDIKVYSSIGGYGSIEKECTLWIGKSFVKYITQELTDDQKRAVEMATGHLSFPTTVVEVKELGCYGCFSVTLQRDDNQRQFIIMLNGWEITH